MLATVSSLPSQHCKQRKILVELRCQTSCV
uniref:Uncharacterized protein n=1 Tax=Nelumbo nucifera TaxID=4432 RepID=A0A822YBE7_NELNU|nr:TPA_asm: hypothetical protein HUJ06_031368 [Nelumbo nucifera]